MNTWGIRPILFEVFGLKIDSYSFFVLLGLIVGLTIYFYQLKNEEKRDKKSLLLVLFAVIGGILGAKLLVFIIYFDKIIIDPYHYNILLSGRSIIGGLIGGSLGAFTARRIFKIEGKRGNQIAIPLIIGISIGRIGCFLKGCCYGVETNLGIGVDFGDKILRHPTQLYEIIFNFLLALYLIFKKTKNPKPGELFFIFMNCYLTFRFFLEFIRVELRSPIGLTDFQIICIVSLLFINRNSIINLLDILKERVLGKQNERKQIH